MYDFNILTINTPVVKASMKNQGIALVRGKPQIYHKAFDITEFIGEHLAGIRGVNSAHYEPICFGKYGRALSNLKRDNGIINVRVGSYDFKGKDSKYYPGIFGYSPESWYMWLDSCVDDVNRQAFIDEHLEMYALDTFMGQYDRMHNTIYEIRPNGECHLGPLFDYESSLKVENSGKIVDYITAFHKFTLISDYHSLINEFPQFAEMLRSYYDVDLVKEIVKMSEERGFDLSNFDLEPYKEFNEASHKKLELILK